MDVSFADIAAVVGALAGSVAAWFAYPNYQQYRARKTLESSFGQKLFGREVIENSTRYYVHPNCSDMDPAREAEYRQVVAVKGNLLATVDEYLISDRHHLLILADSGMGKTSFVLNYYMYNQRKTKSGRWRLGLVPLGKPGADDYIAQIEHKEETVLFLDAFDEDTKAIADHRQRLHELMDACQAFKRVVITCRTQFFRDDEEIPKKTGIVKVGPRKAGEGREYEFWKLYLSPLSDAQVQQYLNKRFRFSPRERQRAWEVVEQIPLLSARPMILAYIPDLLDSKIALTSPAQLYAVMVEKWLEREEDWVENKDALRAFSECLAVDLYINRQKRGGEHIPFREIEPLAKEWGIPLEGWQLRGRSLLNRDAEGNFKFAHRSIMEYLFVKRLVENDSACLGADLTDQMSAFLVPQNSVDIEFVWIPPGKFEMGSSEGDEAERPVHTVQIRQGFLLGKYQVTQAQWEQVMGDNPSHFKGAEHPVDSVSWNDAQKFIQKLNTLEGRNAYRLPSEAEWEYAARAESTAAYCFGDDVKQLRDYAWYDENSENKTHPVGQLKPNARGVYDMHGNVWEWVQDWYAVDYYQ